MTHQYKIDMAQLAKELEDAAAHKRSTGLALVHAKNADAEALVKYRNADAAFTAGSREVRVATMVANHED